MEKTFVIISDSLGDTAKQILKATLAQFDLNNTNSEIFSGVSSTADIDRIVNSLDAQDVFVLSTIVNESLQAHLENLCHGRNMFIHDAINPLIDDVGKFLDQKARREAGAIHKLDHKYFNRVEAIEFAVKYDDGKNLDGISKADIVLLGISRTSKTPLSMYLANLSYKVCNIPIVPEVDVPSEIFEINPKRVIGLTNDVAVLINIRKNRLKAMGFDSGTTYSDAQRIQEEIAYSNSIYKKIGCKIINVANTSIEENAAKIVSYYKEVNR